MIVSMPAKPSVRLVRALRRIPLRTTSERYFVEPCAPPTRCFWSGARWCSRTSASRLFLLLSLSCPPPNWICLVDSSPNQLSQRSTGLSTLFFQPLHLPGQQTQIGSMHHTRMVQRCVRWCQGLAD